MIFRLNEDKTNSKYDKYLRSYDIKVFSNEHGVGHLELKTPDKKYYVFIPTVDEWKNSKTIMPHITDTKPHRIPTDLEQDLVLWFGELSKKANLEGYTNIEFCRFMWDFNNKDNPNKNIVFFDTIKDIKHDENGNEIIPPKFMDISGIKVEIVKEKGNYLKFKYKEIEYELIQGKIFPKSDFLQSIFDKNY